MMLMTILRHYMAPIFIAVGSDFLYYLSVSDYHVGESNPNANPNPNPNSKLKPTPTHTRPLTWPCPCLGSSAHARRLSTPAPCCRSFGEICQSISSVKVPIKGFLVSITKSHVSTPLSSFRKCVLVCTYECQSLSVYVPMCGAVLALRGCCYTRMPVSIRFGARLGSALWHLLRYCFVSLFLFRLLSARLLCCHSPFDSVILSVIYCFDGGKLGLSLK